MAGSNLSSSYPIPFTRLNQDQRDLRQMVGYMSDATHYNVADPNSMMDQGGTRNAVY